MYILSVDLVRSHRHHHVGVVIHRQTFIGELILGPVLDLAVTPGQTTKNPASVIVIDGHKRIFFAIRSLQTKPLLFLFLKSDLNEFRYVLDGIFQIH